MIKPPMSSGSTISSRAIVAFVCSLSKDTILDLSASLNGCAVVMVTGLILWAVLYSLKYSSQMVSNAGSRFFFSSTSKKW